ncbi:MAG: M23 family metallopeptidase, partial [Clostridia bacterium]|nr:M23 family metallopeptidase [Clostridia bacterium]
TRTVYINGDRSSSRSGSDTETIKPMDMLIYLGEEKLDPDEDSPGRHEGEKGPKQGDLTFIAPIEGDISCNFGQLYGVLHLGLDYEPEDDKVFASESGTVVTLLERGGYGLMLEIDHGSGFVTRYAHLDSASVAIGDRVEQGQVIATAGQSGNVEEKTLHFEIRVDGLAYNPRYYLD